MARETIPLALLEALRALNINTDITMRVIVVIDPREGVTVHVQQRVDETSAEALARTLQFAHADVKWIVDGKSVPVPAECGAMGPSGLIQLGTELGAVGPCVRDEYHGAPRDLPGNWHCAADGTQWTDNSLS